MELVMSKYIKKIFIDHEGNILRDICNCYSILSRSSSNFDFPTFSDSTPLEVYSYF